MKKILLLFAVTFFLFSCEKRQPNHDQKDSKGEAFEAGESPAVNVYEVDYEGYKFLLFKEIYNPDRSEQFIGAVLDPRYDQKPLYKITTIEIVDTLRKMENPVQIDLKDPKKTK